MEEVTKVLPAIALRGTTILPDMIVHFDISRPKSVRAVEEAMLGDQKIFLITQKDPDTEVPGLLDVYKIGTIAVIKQVVRMPKDVLRILVEAERRAELLNFEEEESEYLRAEVALFTGSDEMQFSDIEQEAMLRNLKELFAVYCEQTQKVSKELAGQILGTEEVGKLVDIAFIMGCLPLAVATGAGAAARQVVGVGVIGGMITAVFIGVFFIPSFFYLIAKLAGLDKKAARKLQEKEQGAPAPAKQAE